MALLTITNPYILNWVTVMNLCLTRHKKSQLSPTGQISRCKILALCMNSPEHYQGALLISELGSDSKPNLLHPPKKLFIIYYHSQSYFKYLLRLVICYNGPQKSLVYPYHGFSYYIRPTFPISIFSIQSTQISDGKIKLLVFPTL